MEFNKRLEKFLNDHEITQKKLSQLSGITEVTISRYIKGDRIPKLNDALKISKVLNVSLNYLVGYDKPTIEDLLFKLDNMSKDKDIPLYIASNCYTAKLLIERIMENEL